MKIVINRCYGGFGLSAAAVAELSRRKPRLLNQYDFEPKEMRADKDLVAIVETMGRAANGPLAQLVVVEIPDGLEWEIGEYDGLEHVAEKHRTWT